MVRNTIRTMVKIIIKIGLRPANTGVKTSLSQGRIPVASVVSALARGIVTAHMKITGQLTLCSKAVLNGDLVAGSVIMEAGCVVKGHFQVG